MIKKNNKILFALIIVIFTILQNDINAQCNCESPLSLKEITDIEKKNAILSYDIIALGKVSKIFYLNESDTMIKMLVYCYWKGNIGNKDIYLLSTNDPDQCGFNFNIGHDYIIFGTKYQNMYLISSCSPTEHIIDATKEQIQSLGQSKMINKEYLTRDLQDILSLKQSKTNKKENSIILNKKQTKKEA